MRNRLREFLIAPSHTLRNGDKMSEKYVVEHYRFEDKAAYERAQKEAKLIGTMRKKYKLSNGTIALKVYQKALEENVFMTVVGYSFLRELRIIALKTKAAAAEELPEIPIQTGDGEGQNESGQGAAAADYSPKRLRELSRFERLYEGQRLLNKKLKFVVVALVVLVIAFIVVDFKSEYSIFTYFTNYKAKMEEELIHKYEGWESELKAREDALEQSP
jgi:hypothetical protein